MMNLYIRLNLSSIKTALTIYTNYHSKCIYQALARISVQDAISVNRYPLHEYCNREQPPSYRRGCKKFGNYQSLIVILN